MKRANIIEVDYGEFVEALFRSKQAGHAVSMDDKPRWEATVAARDIRLQAFKHIANERFGASDLIILEGKDPWDGLFAFDDETRTCIKFSTELVGGD